jgi:hypothetical protein
VRIRDWRYAETPALEALYDAERRQWLSDLGWDTTEAWTEIEGARTAGRLPGLLAVDGSCPDDLAQGMTGSNVYNTATPGYLALGGGAVAAGITVYLFLRKDDREAARTAIIVPTRGGAMASLALRF